MCDHVPTKKRKIDFVRRITNNIPEGIKILKMDEFLKECGIIWDKHKNQDRALNCTNYKGLQEEVKSMKP